MEHRSQKATVRTLSLAIAVALSTTAWSQDLQFEIHHERALKDRPGRVTLDERGVQYQQVLTAKQQAKVSKGKKPPKLESARWEYQDIQQLWVSPEKLVIVTYKDRKWFLGVDKEFEFFLPKGKSFEAAYTMLKDKLDRRFVAALADSQHGMLWVSLGLLPGNNVSNGSMEDLNRLGSFLGAMAQSNIDQGSDQVPPKSDRETASALGRRVAELARRFNPGN